MEGTELFGGLSCAELFHQSENTVCLLMLRKPPVAYDLKTLLERRALEMDRTQVIALSMQCERERLSLLGLTDIEHDDRPRIQALGATTGSVTAGTYSGRAT